MKAVRVTAITALSLVASSGRALRQSSPRPTCCPQYWFWQLPDSAAFVRGDNSLPRLDTRFGPALNVILDGSRHGKATAARAQKWMWWVVRIRSPLPGRRRFVVLSQTLAALRRGGGGAMQRSLWHFTGSLLRLYHLPEHLHGLAVVVLTSAVVGRNQDEDNQQAHGTDDADCCIHNANRRTPRRIHSQCVTGSWSAPDTASIAV